MDKRPLSAHELLSLATAHASSAQYLLNSYHQSHAEDEFGFNSLFPVTSLMYQAFILSFKAYALLDQRSVRQPKKLLELVELNHNVKLSSKELELLKVLIRQQSYLKSYSFDLWETAQDLQVYCEQLLDAYHNLQQMMPIELHEDYQ